MSESNGNKEAIIAQFLNKGQYEKATSPRVSQFTSTSFNIHHRTGARRTPVKRPTSIMSSRSRIAISELKNELTSREGVKRFHLLGLYNAQKGFSEAMTLRKQHDSTQMED